MSQGKSYVQSVNTTAEHPFYVKGAGFIPAKALVKGMQLLGIIDGLCFVDSIEKSEKTETVYNLSVKENRTYFVTKEGVWVHNICLADIQSGEVLGEGEFGRVYRIEDKAYKVYHKDIVTNHPEANPYRAKVRWKEINNMETQVLYFKNSDTYVLEMPFLPNEASTEGVSMALQEIRDKGFLMYDRRVDNFRQMLDGKTVPVDFDMIYESPEHSQRPISPTSRHVERLVIQEQQRFYENSARYKRKNWWQFWG